MIFRQPWFIMSLGLACRLGKDQKPITLVIYYVSLLLSRFDVLIYHIYYGVEGASSLTDYVLIM
jgi:hypothetical protein